MKIIRTLLQALITKGFHLSVSDGKPFDPREQERTRAMDDLLKEDKDGTKRRSE